MDLGERLMCCLQLLVNITDVNKISQGDSKEPEASDSSFHGSAMEKEPALGDHKKEDREAGGEHQVAPKPKEESN